MLEPLAELAGSTAFGMGRSGMRTENVDPFPGPSLVAVTDPPCAAINDPQIESPNPSPPNVRVTASPPCSKAVKIIDR
jgi:hypothetical protein